jgi:hypothetical protein
MSRSVVTHRRRRRRILQELIDDVNTYTLNESVNSCELVSSDQSVNSEQESTVPQLTLENYACGRPLSHEQCKEGKTQQNSETRVFLRVPPCLSNSMRPSAKKTSIAQIPLPTPPTLVPPSRKMRTRTRSWTSPGHD